MQLLKELQGVGDLESLDPGLGGARDTPTALQDLRNPLETLDHLEWEQPGRPRRRLHRGAPCKQTPVWEADWSG